MIYYFSFSQEHFARHKSRSNGTGRRYNHIQQYGTNLIVWEAGILSHCREILDEDLLLTYCWNLSAPKNSLSVSSRIVSSFCDNKSAIIYVTLSICDTVTLCMTH